MTRRSISTAGLQRDWTLVVRTVLRPHLPQARNLKKDQDYGWLLQFSGCRCNSRAIRLRHLSGKMEKNQLSPPLHESWHQIRQHARQPQEHQIARSKNLVCAVADAKTQTIILYIYIYIIYIYVCIFPPPRDVPICLAYLYHRRVSAQLHLHRRCRLACCLVLLAKYPCLTHSPQFGSQTALATITSVIAALELVPFYEVNICC